MKLPRRYAFHGPMLSGKSTISRLLEEQHQFLWANYTDYGKKLCAKALSALLGRPVTTSEVVARKNEWREFLIASLRIYGFDQGNGIDALLRYCEVVPETDVAFDNVRYLAQYQKLQPFGFRLVRLAISDELQQERAAQAGMPQDKLLTLRHEASEAPLPIQPGEIFIYVDGKTPDQIVEHIFAWDNLLRQAEKDGSYVTSATIQVPADCP